MEMLKQLGEDAMQYSQFCHIWNTEYPDVVIPPTQRMGKCDICADLHERICGETDKDKRQALKQDRYVQIKEMSADRLVDYNWRGRCAQFPDQYHCIIVDGMYMCNLACIVIAPLLCVRHGSVYGM